MTKDEILKAFIEMSKTAVPSRDDFVKALGISKNIISKYFGSYNGLKDALIARLDGFTPELSDASEVPFCDDNDDPQTVEDLAKAASLDPNIWAANRVNVAANKGKISLRGEFKRKKDVTAEEMAEHFVRKAANYAPPAPNFLEPINADGDYMYFISISDLHLGSLVTDGEGEYNIEIAKECYINAVAELFGKVQGYRIKKVVLLVGSDFFHSDGLVASTTTKGTYVEADCRFSNTFTEGADLLVDVATRISQVYEVSLIHIAGNHDRQNSYFLAKYLEAWFRNNERVEVDAENSPRKYFSWGNTLLGLTHGDGVKLDNLPMIMLKENQSTISNYKYLEWATGHLHSTSEREQFGVKIRILPSLAKSDRWHSSRGFIGNLRSAQGFLYSKEDGLTATFYSKPL